jgi:hypothetical protein
MSSIGIGIKEEVEAGKQQCGMQNEEARSFPLGIDHLPEMKRRQPAAVMVN